MWFPPVHWLPLGETLALAIFGPLIARRLNIPAGAFLVPMIGGIVLTHLGLMTVELPPWLLAASYALVGWNVGLRFSRPLLIHAARQLPRVMACILTMIVLCGGVAWLMVLAIGVDPLTAYLATSPGGSDSVAIIAASTNVDVSFVMAMQTVRMIAVLFIGPVLTKYIVTHSNPVPASERTECATETAFRNLRHAGSSRRARLAPVAAERVDIQSVAVAKAYLEFHSERTLARGQVLGVHPAYGAPRSHRRSSRYAVYSSTSVLLNCGSGLGIPRSARQRTAMYWRRTTV